MEGAVEREANEDGDIKDAKLILHSMQLEQAMDAGNPKLNYVCGNLNPRKRNVINIEMWATQVPFAPPKGTLSYQQNPP